MKKKPGAQLNGRVRRSSILLSKSPMYAIKEGEGVVARAIADGKAAGAQGKPCLVPPNFAQGQLTAIAWANAWKTGRGLSEAAKRSISGKVETENGAIQ